MPRSPARSRRATPSPGAGTALDRDTAYDLIASQIAETFAGYEAGGVARDRQMLIALATVVKLTVENFVLHQRLMRTSARPRRAAAEPHPSAFRSSRRACRIGSV